MKYTQRLEFQVESRRVAMLELVKCDAGRHFGLNLVDLFRCYRRSILQSING